MFLWLIGFCEQKPTAKVRKICQTCKFFVYKFMSLFVYCDFFERVFLFGGHLGFCLGGFVGLPREMQ